MTSFRYCPLVACFAFAFAVHADPPKLLVIGPRSDGQLLEVIILSLADDRELVIHAMAVRPTFHYLLPLGNPR